MIFTTKIAGIPCKCEVIFHTKPKSTALKDIEFQILDSQGHKAPWLAKKLTQADDFRLRDEFQAASFAHKYGIDF